jgi:hypothetical protein
LLPRFRSVELELEQRRAVARAINEARALGVDIPTTTSKPAPAELRGIPVLGVGVDGAIAGTKPGVD